MSAGPPAANGTTIFTGRAGHVCAPAASEATARSAATKAATVRCIQLTPLSRQSYILRRPDHARKRGVGEASQEARSPRTRIPARRRLRQRLARGILGSTYFFGGLP